MANKTTPEEKTADKKRHGILYWAGFIVFAIIIISFIGAPIVTRYYSQGYSGDVVGYYDGKEIKIGAGGYFDRQLSSLMTTYQSQLENAGQSRPFLEYQLYNQALTSTAVHLEAVSLANKAGLTISPKTVDKAIINAYTEYGKFNEKAYKSVSPIERKKLRDFYRETILAQTVMSDIASSQKVSSAEADFVAGMEYPQRKITYVAYDTNSFPDSELIKFAEENKDMFRKRELSQITINKQQDAERLYQDILKDPSIFEDMAKEKSVDNYANNGGKAGALPYAQLTEYIDKKDADAVFSLKTGEIAGVIKAKTGKYLIIKADGDVKDAELDKQDTLNYIKRYVMNYHKDVVDKYFYTMAEELKKAGKESFASVASRQGLEPKETKYFPINIGNVDIFTSPKADPNDNIMSQAASSEDFYKAVFTTPVGDITGPINLGNIIIVARIDDEKTKPDDDNELEFVKQYYEQAFVNRGINSDIYAYLIDKDKLKSNLGEIAKQLFSQGANSN